MFKVSDFLIGVGEQVAVSIFRNNESMGAVVLKRPSSSVIESSVYIGDQAERDFFLSALEQASFVMEAVGKKEELQHLISKAIAEIDENEDGEDGEPPYPTDVTVIPF
jgi:hypothetical protein